MAKHISPHVDASTPAFAGGKNYAVGGAHTDFIGPAIDILGFPIFRGPLGMHSQVGMHILNNPPSDDSLYVLWGGGNDFIDGETDVGTPAWNMAINIYMLKEFSNAKNFLVANLPPLGYLLR